MLFTTETFKFIKAVSDNVGDMMTAVYCDKPLIFIGATFLERLVSHHQAVDEADSCLLMRRVGSKPWYQQRNRTSLDVCRRKLRNFQRPWIIG